MNERLNETLNTITNAIRGHRRLILTAGIAAVGAWALVAGAPLQSVERGDVAVRTNAFTGASERFDEGSVVVLPGLHQLRRLSLRDQVWRPAAGATFQSVEGLSFGADIAVRYALDPAKVTTIARSLPDNLSGEIVEPAVTGVVYKVLARYTVRETFSSKRAEIAQAIEAELKPRLAADGVLLRGVQFGRIALPDEYRRGMDKLLAEELETEKMRFTLELKDKRVKETELEAQAEKVRRETAAAAAAREQVIAAQAQEEAMRHVLPFKQKQIEQRQLEAEAAKVARIKQAEAEAAARKLEAAGEAESRQKLADAEAYRMERVGRIASEQMARDGELVSRHPLLIQKTLADKLSDKIQVIIAPPGTGGLVTAGLINTSAPVAQAQAGNTEEAAQ